MDKDIFAEIEYEFTPSTQANPVSRKLPPMAELIGASTPDPIRRRFYDMRGLASNNPYTWNDARLFYKQAKFMEDFADDYEGCAEFFMHHPCYQRMGYERLRTYFTWRVRTRKGDFAPIGLSYIFLYVYELLGCIGVSEPADGLAQLMRVWMAYRATESALDEYIPSWMRDFHVYYELPRSFVEFVEEHGLREFYGEMFLFDTENDGLLEAWNKISGYDVTKSKFYAVPENAALLGRCFGAVIRTLDGFSVEKGTRLKSLFALTSTQRISWEPFRRAMFHPWLRQSDRYIELPGGEIFHCQNNEFTVNYSAPYAHRKDVAGFFIKKTEACVRHAIGFKSKITADVSSTHKATTVLREMNLTARDLESTIESAVAEYFRELNRVVVTVDRTNLDRIRVEAHDTQDKLIVEEVVSEVVTIEPTPKAKSPQPANGWDALKQALSEAEHMALALIICGGDIRALADEHGIMLEVLADGINEKALDTIGDNILEFTDDLVAYDDYVENIREIVG